MFHVTPYSRIGDQLDENIISNISPRIAIGNTQAAPRAYYIFVVNQTSPMIEREIHAWKQLHVVGIKLKSGTEFNIESPGIESKILFCWSHCRTLEALLQLLHPVDLLRKAGIRESENWPVIIVLHGLVLHHYK